MAWNVNKLSVDDKCISHNCIKNHYTRAILLFLLGVMFLSLIVYLGINSKNDEIFKKNENRIVQAASIDVVPDLTNRTCAPTGSEIFVDPEARPTKLGQKVNGYVLLPNGHLHKIQGETHLTPTKPKSAIFDYPADNIISGILSMEPGDPVLGTANYNGRFTRAFLKSLQSPIIVQASDSDDVKELKRAVNEAKIELKNAYDRGEDIEEMIVKAREEFRDLAQYKQDLRKELLRYANREAPSPEDVDDYMKAANIMLEQRGIAPIDDIPFARIKFQMRESWENTNE